MYPYVAGNPINLTDPTGEVAAALPLIPLAVGAAGAYAICRALGGCRWPGEAGGVTSSGTAVCLALDGVERLRADDFREGNIILDVTISVGAAIEMEDVAYAYGPEPNDEKILTQTMERLVRERRTVVRVSPSYGCTLVCICSGIEVEDDWLAIVAAEKSRARRP